jgi:hypothetical protein
MQAKTVKQFRMVPPGEIHGRQFEAGEIVSGRVAEVALAEGWAAPLDAANDEIPVSSSDGNGPPGSGPNDGAPAPVPQPVVRAKLTKRHIHKSADGIEEIYAKGTVIEGDLARAFVEAGVAEFIGK